ncbi:MAG TPA: trypsin-like peptidase domain-containing protein [Alphaproteobacteria bacterium]
MRKLARVSLVIGLLLSAEVAAGKPCTKSFEDVFRDVSPSVVLVGAFTIDPYRGVKRSGYALGTGVLVRWEGQILVLTNAHVVYGSSAVFVAGVAGGQDRRFEGKLLGADPILDLAVIGIAQAPASITVATLAGQDSDLEIGQDVAAIGHPFGYRRTITRGIVSGLNRIVPVHALSWLTPLIQTDAAINPGNSGGPLVNRCGEVVGINTLGAPSAENIGFAIPIGTARRALPDLVTRGRVMRAWHGINGRFVNPLVAILARIPHTPGLLIETIEPGSPAEKAGLRGGVFAIGVNGDDMLLGGDVVTAVNGMRLSDLETAMNIVASLKAGETVVVDYYREGKTYSIRTMLPERPILPGDVQFLRGRREAR